MLIDYWYNRLKAQLLEAISRDWQGRALDACNAAWEILPAQQARELQDIYDEWERSWADAESN